MESCLSSPIQRKPSAVPFPLKLAHNVDRELEVFLFFFLVFFCCLFSQRATVFFYFYFYLYLLSIVIHLMVMLSQYYQVFYIYITYWA